MKFIYKSRPPFLLILRLAKYDIDEVDHYLTSVEETHDSRLDNLRKLLESEKTDGLEDRLADDLAQLDDFAMIASEFAIIGLWRSVELYRGRAILATLDEKGAGIAFKNKKFVEHLTNLGIAEDTLSYAGSVNELRCLNNAIKHTRRVTGELSKFASWRKKKGEDLGNLSSHYRRLKPLTAEYLENLTEHFNEWWKKKTAQRGSAVNRP